MTLLLESATSNEPLGWRASPEGALKVELGPAPLLSPALPFPASVVTNPDSDTFRIRLIANSET